MLETEVRNLKQEVAALRIAVDALKKVTWEQTGAIAAIVVLTQIAIRYFH